MTDVKDIALLAKNAPIVFLDLDMTLTDADTDMLWYRWRIPRRPTEWVNYFYLKKLYRRYKSGMLTEHELAEFHERRVGRTSPAAFRKSCDYFFEMAGKARIFQKSYDLVAALRSNGSKLALITAQHDLIAEPFSKHLRLDDTLGSHLNENGKRFAGVVLPLCFREGKIPYAEEYCRKLNAKIEDCAFFSDSSNDLPLLEKVGVPVATNPDPELERTAAERGWPILLMA